ncbi:hypothetical protein [Streptomyces sp. NPDC051016]|uniref:hypothetical protein n=1 Tax=Streptomyces sp. NPDC051016 TaxID=3365638 RepID=UPI00379B84FC
MLEELGEWLVGEDPERAASARLALKEAAERESPHVAALARRLLASVLSTAAPTTQTSAGMGAVPERIAAPVVTEPPPVVALTVAEADLPDDDLGDEDFDVVRHSMAAEALDQAEQTAGTIADEHDRARALVDIVEEIAGMDPDRAVRIAGAITVERRQAQALSAVAKAVAKSDLERAERVARSISRADELAKTLSSIARAAAATDPDEAERIASSIADESARELALSGVAEEVAGTDPDRAERLAARIDEVRRGYALQHIAAKVAITDPDRAMRIAAQITGGFGSAELPFKLADRMAANHPARGADLAERVVGRLTTRRGYSADAMVRVAAKVAAIDPDQAERVAESACYLPLRARILVRVAQVVAAADPDRAERLAVRVEDITASVNPVDPGLPAIVADVAPLDPDRAERIAASIAVDPKRNAALELMSSAMADTHPERAERTAVAISDSLVAIRALMHIAGAAGPGDLDRITRLTSRAEILLETIPHENWKVLALTEIGRAVAATDPGHAAELAQRIATADTQVSDKDSALMDLSKAIAVADAETAVGVAGAITSLRLRMQALESVVLVVAATDPRKARRIAARVLTDDGTRRKLVEDLFREVPASDPAHALGLARLALGVAEAIGESRSKAWALAAIAKQLTLQIRPIDLATFVGWYESGLGPQW